MEIEERTLALDSDGNPCVWENHYRCPVCEEEIPDDDPTTDASDWVSEWSCQCNENCPHCGTEVEPYHSEWIGPKPEVTLEQIDSGVVSIVIYAIREASDTESSLCPIGEKPDHFDVTVRDDSRPDFLIEEFEELTFEQATKKAEELGWKYPGINVTWEYA